MSEAEISTWRQRLYRQLVPAAWERRGLSPLNRLVVLLIVCSVTAAVLETELSLQGIGGVWIWRLEVAFAVVFGVEYLARAWVAVENPRFAQSRFPRLRYLLTPAALLDLAALLPPLLALAGSESFLLRAARLLRILRLARLGRFSRAMSELGQAIRSRRFELLLSLGVAGGLLLLSSTLLHLAEQAAQPEDFGSIPRAMWWSIATLTTVGYGDVYPVTALGKFFAAVTALTGIGLIAMPTGILAAALSDALQRRDAEAAANRVVAEGTVAERVAADRTAQPEDGTSG